MGGDEQLAGRELQREAPRRLDLGVERRGRVVGVGMGECDDNIRR